jgi:hypothetical protein
VRRWISARSSARCSIRRSSRVTAALIESAAIAALAS